MQVLERSDIILTVVRTSPICNLYKIVVLPAASSPSITTRISRAPKSLSNNDANIPDTVFPMAAFVFLSIKVQFPKTRFQHFFDGMFKATVNRYACTGYCVYG